MSNLLKNLPGTLTEKLVTLGHMSDVYMTLARDCIEEQRRLLNTATPTLPEFDALPPTNPSELRSWAEISEGGPAGTASYETEGREQ